MAEIGIAAGILGLSAFAYKSSESLHKHVQGIKSHQKELRELGDELEALGCVLTSLQRAAAADSSKLKTLNLPLFRCGKACNEFEELLNRYTSRSQDHGTNTKVLNWVKFRSKRDQIARFKESISVYKATVNIALGEANLNSTIVATKALEDYKTIINDTTSDIKDCIVNIDEKLGELALQSTRTTEDQNIQGDQQKEKESMEQCLAICAKASEQASQVRQNMIEDNSAGQDARQIIASSVGDLISAKNNTAGISSVQILGQMNVSEDVLLQLARGSRTAKGGESK